MPSAIDPLHPEDGLPASKADLRANLAAAKSELEHGGFAEGLSPANYGPPASSRVVDHLQAIDDTLGGGIGGVSAFTDLVDTPSDYIGQANRYARVKGDETGLEFIDQAAGGDASTTSYNGAGTGAVTRSVQDKLREMVSVTDFGAVGDGTTDDTAAIQAAIDYVEGLSASNSVGGNLFFSPGSYLIQTTLVSEGQCTFLGSAKGSIIKAGGSFPSTVNIDGHTFAAPMLYVQSGQSMARCMIDNMQLDGNNNAPIGLLSTSGSTKEFRSLRVDDCILDGIALDAVQNSSFYNCMVFNTGRHGFRIFNSCRYLGFYSCFQRDAGETGLTIEGDDADYPGEGQFFDTTNTTWVGGLLEGNKSGSTRNHIVNITTGIDHKF